MPINETAEFTSLHSVPQCCLHIIDDRRRGEITNAEAIHKLMLILPNESLKGALTQYLKQLSEVVQERMLGEQ